jgi:hypothetical protein
MTLALRGNFAWVACKEQSRVIRVDVRNGKTLKSVRLRGPAIAVVNGFSSIWSLDSGGSLYRLNTTSGKIVRRIETRARAAYNIWVGGGSLWVADDQGAQVLRISPRTNKVVRRISVSDGPADMAFSGGAAWVIDHRDRMLYRIDLSTNNSKALGAVAGEDQAPERMVWARSSLWITGRGADVLKVNPADGSVEQTIEIGASGIDIAADGDDLLVPTRSAAVDATGLPTMDALKRVSISTGSVSLVSEARGRVDVHGFLAAGGTVWIADNTGGRLFRIAKG